MPLRDAPLQFEFVTPLSRYPLLFVLDARTVHNAVFAAFSQLFSDKIFDRHLCKCQTLRLLHETQHAFSCKSFMITMDKFPKPKTEIAPSSSGSSRIVVSITSLGVNRLLRYHPKYSMPIQAICTLNSHTDSRIQPTRVRQQLSKRAYISCATVTDAHVLFMLDMMMAVV